MRRLKPVESLDARDTEFGQFLMPYFDMIYGRAYRLTRNVDDAEDLVQELCIRAYGEFNSLKNMNNPTGWLLRVLYRLFIDQTRRISSSPVRLLTKLEQEEGLLEASSNDPGPAEMMETALLRRNLSQALRALRPEDQALLILHEVEGYSLTEIEDLTEMPQSTVKSRLQRARIRLGRLLKPEQEQVETNQSRGSEHELQRRHRTAG